MSATTDENADKSAERSGTVVAFGGNALSTNPSEDGIEQQLQRASEAIDALLPLFADRKHPVYLVHGNGPQVGQELLRQDEASRHLPAMPLEACVAGTQGWIGYILESSIRNALSKKGLNRDVITICSQVEVDASDEAFNYPSKPIGPFYTRYRARQLTRERGWLLRKDSGRGYRMIVPSPTPKKIHGVAGAKLLSENGYIVIVGGGGGVPVTKTAFGEVQGIEAVIDKDATAELIGQTVGASQFLLITGVSEVCVAFGTPEERALRDVSLSEMISLYEEGHFPAGSMGPKVSAAIRFLKNGGDTVIITSIPCIEAALIGNSGTRIHRDEVK